MPPDRFKLLSSEAKKALYFLLVKGEALERR